MPVSRQSSPLQIGRYRILSELGRGSMGRVYLAFDPHIERRVALKVVSTSPEAPEGQREELRRRFLLEARAAGRLSHPHLVAIHDADRDPQTGMPYLVMEWVEGTSLGRRLQEGALPLDEAVRIVTDVARALDYVHGQGLLHRDVKPNNLLIDLAGVVKVADFGIARPATQPVTVAGHLVGTPQYMSPEQVRGEPLDGRSDLFSLGSVLYECLTGARAFPGDSLATITYKVVHVDPRPASLVHPEIGEAVGAVVERAIAKRAQDRFQSGEELAAALLEATEGDGVRGRSRPGGGLVVALPAFQEDEGGGAGSGTAGEAPALRRRGAPRRRAVWLAAGLGLLVLTAVTIGGAGRLWQAPPEAATETRTEAAPVPAAAPVPTATLIVLHENRLRQAFMSVWVNGERVWSRQLVGPRNPLSRMAGVLVTEAIQVPAGPVALEVRISGYSMQVEASARLEGRLAEGETRRLKARLNPYRQRLSLSWVE